MVLRCCFNLFRFIPRCKSPAKLKFFSIASYISFDYPLRMSCSLSIEQQVEICHSDRRHLRTCIVLPSSEEIANHSTRGGKAREYANLIHNLHADSACDKKELFSIIIKIQV